MNSALPLKTAQFFESLANGNVLTTLFNRLSDCVFSLKDIHGRYIAISDTCVTRCGLSSANEAIGKTAFDLFPTQMAARYHEQDLQVFKTGKAIYDTLDLTLFKNRQHGWCITHKIPLTNPMGEIIGLACISRDIQENSEKKYVDSKFAKTIDYIQSNYDKPCRVESLATMAGLSVSQYERRIKTIYQLTPSQFLTKTRIEKACNLLSGDNELTIAEVALHCGYCDQSALTRYFKQVTGLTPGEYRRFMKQRKRPTLRPFS